MMSVRAASVLAQGKINLFLRVLAREASGYHQLETLFCRLSLGDDVTVRVTDAASRSLECSGAALPNAGLGPVERNLAWRAATAFADAASWPRGFTIEIEKRIPVGGGLGGGSADAGAVLRCLNALAPDPLPDAHLLQIAGSLGADVPFLTQATSPLALAWGRGDQLLALPALPARRCDLLLFPFGVSTVDAYRWLAESPAPTAAPRIVDVRSLEEWHSVDSLSYNEFERVVFPRVERIRSSVAAVQSAASSERGAIVRMSGSGSTVFVLSDENTQTATERGRTLAEELHAIAGVALSRTTTASAVEAVRVHD